jgi:hypothetical protein
MSHWQMVWDLSQLIDHIQDIIAMDKSVLSNHNTFCENTYNTVYYHAYTDPMYVTYFEF